MTADEKKIIRSLRSFSGGCCGGIDKLHPAHLLDLVAVSTADAGLHLRRSITNLTNKILRGDVSDYAVKLLFSSNLTALRIKDGGVRPIAVGNVFRRLATKATPFLAQCRMSSCRSSSVFRLREVQKRRSTKHVNLSLTTSTQTTTKS